MLTRIVRSLNRRLPIILLVWGIGACAFLYGYAVRALNLGPSLFIIQAHDAYTVLRDRFTTAGVQQAGAWTDLSPAEGAKRRVVVKQAVDDGNDFLLTGGEGQYLEYCPEHGCTAVTLKRDGSLVHAYPFRPDELASKRTVELPYEEFAHDDTRDTTVFGLAPLPGGDLVAVYDFAASKPFGGGIARLDKDGHILWYRRDYSHHWPLVVGGSEILDLSMDLTSTHTTLEKQGKYTIDCATGIMKDIVRVLSMDGQVKEVIPIFDALAASPYGNYMLGSFDPGSLAEKPCEPLHANSVTLVGPEIAAKLANVAPDDLLVSLRNISALVVIGRKDHRVKYLFKGTFLYQHSAQVAPGGKILLFDNLGGGGAGGPSRVLQFDPATNEERTIFPRGDVPQGSMLSKIKGNIDLSMDGTRALVASPQQGKAYEIRVSDGAVLTTFDNLQDVSSLRQFSNRKQKVRYFDQNGVYYFPSRGSS